ncbi:regulatory subunit for phosphoprotein phosphatase type 1 [Scheffersomyces coipomensis]|uniref:regulatory subunit for phosphoprotein phosphatase type 1 n=1 Tax=Scheffersomyces coipomensis TaxID=1788519 RepID=UPI00315D9174
MSIIVTATATTTTTTTSSPSPQSTAIPSTNNVENNTIATSSLMSASSSSCSSTSSTSSSSPFLQATDSTDSLNSQSSVSTIKLSPSPSLTIYKPLQKQYQSHQQIHHTLDVPKIVPPLVRKKSGELVKSSLKLPSLLPKALSTSQLNRSKSVRFASRLTNIKMFDGMESPSTVSTSDNTPIHSPQFMDEFDDLQDEYTLQSSLPPLSMKGQRHHNSHRHKRSDYFQWYGNDLASDTSSDEDDWSIHPTTIPRSNSASAASYNPQSQSNTNTGNKKEYKIVYNNLPSMHPYNQPVYVASISLIKEFGKSFLFGLINVENMGFEKNLMIKLSMNNWLSNIIFNNGLTTSFNKSINSNTDQFKFKILLDDLIGEEQAPTDKNGNINIQMCIKYTVNNHQVYWDSNNGANYQIHLAPMLSGIQSYTYKPSTPSQKANQQQVQKQVQKQEYQELVLKLKAIEFEPETTNQSQPVASFSLKYNFTDHDSNVRPSLKHSYSASDIPQSRYSQAYKSKHQQQSQPSSNLNSVSSARPLSTDFSSLSYTDIINKFCFSNGESTITSGTVNASAATTAVPLSTTTTPSIPFHQPLPIKIAPPNESTNSLSCSPTPASTFHSFSDSIHI